MECTQARQTEHMIDLKMHGEGMDGVLARKLHESGPFASFLAGLATKHEVEAMRKVNFWWTDLTCQFLCGRELSQS